MQRSTKPLRYLDVVVACEQSAVLGLALLLPLAALFRLPLLIFCLAALLVLGLPIVVTTLLLSLAPLLVLGLSIVVTTLLLCLAALLVLSLIISLAWWLRLFLGTLLVSHSFPASLCAYGCTCAQ